MKVFVISCVTALLVASITLASGTPGRDVASENTLFSQFASHILRQLSQDKQAFAQASTCLSWFYKRSKPAPPAVQGIVWRQTAALQSDQDCRRHYPGGMDAAREDFARTQTSLSVSLTIYQFALVADVNDDHAYNTAELSDLFHSLSLTLDGGDASLSPLAALTDRFDRWYRLRNLDEVMKGMGILYDRGYRVTAKDRADLDRVMK